MRLHDLAFGLACLAAASHVAWLTTREPELQPQPSGVDPALLAADAEALDLALAQAEDFRSWTAAGEPRDVLIIALAGVRADALAGPSLRWLPAARHFSDLRSTAPYAEAALGSLAVGALPTEHGAHRSRRGALLPLSPVRPSLAERLGEAGWWTASISALPQAQGLQLDRGFSVALDAELTLDALPYVEAERVTALALRLLEARGETPVMLQLTYADAELPWLIREGPCAASVPLPDAVPGGDAFGPGWRKRSQAVLSGQRPASEAELETWSTAYGAELCVLERSLELLLSEGAGLGPEDLVVVVGLNGQGLGEEGRLGSGRGVEEGLLAVPLWARGPELVAGEDPRALSLHELPDLILSWAGAPPLPPPERPPPPGVRVAELHGPSLEDLQSPLRLELGGSAWSLREADHAYVLRSDARYEAFELAADPGQRAPVEEAAWLPALQALAQAWVVGDGAAAGLGLGEVGVDEVGAGEVGVDEVGAGEVGVGGDGAGRAGAVGRAGAPDAGEAP